MNHHPLYPYSHRKLCLKIMFLTLFVMVIISITFSFLYPSPFDGLHFFYTFVLKKLISFSLLLILTYSFFSYFFFKTLVIDKEKKTFSICRSLCGRVLHKKTFRLKNAKAVILKKNSKIKNLHQIALEGKKLNVFWEKGARNLPNP